MAVAQWTEMSSEFLPPGITGNLSYEAGGKPSMEGWPHETHLEAYTQKPLLGIRGEYPRGGAMHDWLPHRADTC